MLHSVFEHDIIEDFKPSQPHFRLLNIENTRRKSFLLKPIFSNGTPRLRATHHVGILRLGNTTLQILPKMFRPSPDKSEQECQNEATRNLLTMLSYAYDLPLLHHAAPLHHQPHDWLELLTRLFATNLLQQLQAAPHRNYQSFDDDLPLLRGKLRIADQLRRPDRQHRFACTFDEFTLDNPLNRTFRFVIERLFFQTIDPANRQLLNQLRTLLDEVPLPSHCTPENADPAKLITRLNRRYQPTLELARLFLSKHTPHLTHGPTETINFLFDMNDLFEKFTANFLKKHRPEILSKIPTQTPNLVSEISNPKSNVFSEISNLKSAIISFQRPQKSLLHEPAIDHDHFLLKPDITFQIANQFPLIVDTKYKCLDTSKPRYDIASSDMYQMLAYAHRYRCPRILLLYPQTADIPTPFRKTFTFDNTITITAATINLTRDLTALNGRNALINELHTLLTKSVLCAPPPPKFSR